MNISVSYNGIDDRQVKVKENESQGLRMLHDNFDNPDWEYGDLIVGTMTFTDELPPVNPLELVRDLVSEIDELKDKVAALEESRDIIK